MNQKPSKEVLHSLFITQNKTAQEVADELGYAKNSISAYLWEYGITKSKFLGYVKKPERSDAKQIVEWYNQGQTTYEIGRRLGIADTTVGKCLKRNGVTLSDGSIDIFKVDCGKLTILEEVSPTRYLCQCVCGTQKVCQKKRLLDGRNTSCGCSMNKHPNRLFKGRPTSRSTGYEDITGARWYSMKNGAKNRGIDFNVTMQEAWNQYIQQNRKCALTGIDIEMPLKQYSKDRTRTLPLASLDRKDSRYGYNVDNIQWILRDINLMKSDLRQDIFVNLCRKVSEYEGSVDRALSGTIRLGAS